MSTRPTRNRLTSLEDVIKLLGNPDKVGKNMTWVGNDYSLRDLILDLREVQNAHQQQQIQDEDQSTDPYRLRA